jgi:dTDP-4-dehydrorhamnose 3,5-epimerase
VEIRPLAIEGALELTPRQFGDDRGVFLEWFKDEAFTEAVGHRLDLRQANCSVSAAGVLRGLHFADVPPGQAKYVTCATGAVLDVVVDVRVGSSTFGHWDAVLLDDVDRRATYLAEGLGHAFLSLEDASTVLYLCSAPYAPGHEHGVHPLDPALGIDWPTTTRDGQPLTPRLSDKDAAAPTLREAMDAGLLPSYEECQAFTGSLRAQARGGAEPSSPLSRLG